MNTKSLSICLVTSSRYENTPRCIRAAISLSRYYNVKVVDFSGGHDKDIEYLVGDIRVIKLATKAFSKNKLIRFIKFFTKVFPFLVRDNSDLYHCFGFTAYLISLPLKIFLRRRLIYDCYEHYPYQFTAPSLNKTLWQTVVWGFISLLENLFVHFADYVFVVPSCDNILFDRFKKYQAKISVIWNLPSNRIFNKIEKIKLNSKSRVILYVGGIGKDTGVFKLIEAFTKIHERYPNVKVLLVGSSTTSTLLMLKKYIKSLGIEEKIEILNPVPYFTVGRYYCLADISVVLYQPTFWTLRTMASEKLFESMFFALPVVGSDFPGLRKIVRSCNSGILVDPTDSEKIAEAIIKLLENPQLAFELGKNGRYAILTKYNWEIEEQKLINVYKHLVEKL